MTGKKGKEKESIIQKEEGINESNKERNERKGGNKYKYSINVLNFKTVTQCDLKLFLAYQLNIQINPPPPKGAFWKKKKKEHL